MLRDQRVVLLLDFGVVTSSLVSSGLHNLSQASDCQDCEPNKREARAFSYDARSSTDESDHCKSCCIPCQFDEGSKQIAMHGPTQGSRQAGIVLACEA